MKTPLTNGGCWFQSNWETCDMVVWVKHSPDGFTARACQDSHPQKARTYIESWGHQTIDDAVKAVRDLVTTTRTFIP